MGNEKPFLLQESFAKWLTDKDINVRTVKEESVSSYYLRHHFNDDENQPFYYDVIASFLYHDDLVYAYTALYKWGSKIKVACDSKTYSYWKKYEDFIWSSKICKNSYVKKLLLKPEKLKEIKESLNKSELYKFDGMNSILNRVGPKEFIKLAIESSFFFDPAIAKERHGVIVGVIKGEKHDDLYREKNAFLPARKSQTDDDSQKNLEGTHNIKDKDKKEGTYTDEHNKFTCNIKQDGNGNAKVCQLINKKFRYDQSLKSEEKAFKNFIISHIWGRAIDPRYFTNLWNIALVPAWANHLLDKNPPEETFASVFKNTMMKLCKQHYDLDNEVYQWEDIGIDGTPKVSCEDDVLPGRYRINVILPPEDKLAGRIIKKTITIRKDKAN